MNNIKVENYSAYDWLNKIPPTMWSRQAFDSNAKSDHITNTMSESFNQWVGPLREKPVLTVVESVMVKLMGKIHNRYSAGIVWEHNITLKALQKVENMRSRTNRCSLVPAGQMEFVVNDNGKRFPIDLKKFICHCKYWEISGNIVEFVLFLLICCNMSSYIIIVSHSNKLSLFW